MGFIILSPITKKDIDIWNPSNRGKVKIFVNTIIAGIVAMFIFAFLSNNYQVYHLITYFVTFVGLFFIVILVMIHINNRK